MLIDAFISVAVAQQPKFNRQIASYGRGMGDLGWADDKRGSWANKINSCRMFMSGGHSSVNQAWLQEDGHLPCTPINYHYCWIVCKNTQKVLCKIQVLPIRYPKTGSMDAWKKQLPLSSDLQAIPISFYVTVQRYWLQISDDIQAELKQVKY